MIVEGNILKNNRVTRLVGANNHLTKISNLFFCILIDNNYKLDYFAFIIREKEGGERRGTEREGERREKEKG